MNLTELKAICEAATPGPWRNGWMMDGQWIDSPIFDIEVSTESGKTIIESGNDCGGIKKQEDARFIATFNPAFVLKLLAVMEAASRDMNSAVDLARLDQALTALEGETE